MPDDAPDAAEPQTKRGLVLAGRYRLERAIDTGGMSSVWLAHDTSLDVEVAIKLLRMPRHPKDAEVARSMAVRLVHEAQVVARVRHPAIVSVIDVAETDWGQPFIVMELLVGENLDAVVRRDGSLTAIDAVRMLLPVVQGMAVAHEKGIIHRDLKPANVFLARTDDGKIQPKVIDFGIAKSERLDRMDLTKQGETMGSPAYMSPEQVRGEEADARSDVWSLCMTLYELVSGKLPFERPTDVASMLAILETEADTLAQLGFDETLSAIVERGMKKDPKERWQSLTELEAELVRFLDGHGVAHAPGAQRSDGASERPLSIPGVQPPRRRELGLVIVGSVGLASLLVIALSLRASFATPNEAPLAPVVAAASPETTASEMVPPPPVEKAPEPAPEPPPASAQPKPPPVAPTPKLVVDAAVPSEPAEPSAPTEPAEQLPNE